MRLLPDFVLVAVHCSAQHLAIGVKGAAVPTGPVEGYADSESKRYLVGPTFEAILPWHFGIAVDALYSRFGYRTVGTDILGSYTQTNVRANVWQFPIVARYRFHDRLHPYVEGGVSVRYAGQMHANVSGYYKDYYGGVQLVSGSYTQGSDSTVGAVVGAGLELGAGRHWTVSPGVRYVRWKDPLVNESGSRGYYVRGVRNEAQITVGITWR